MANLSEVSEYVEGHQYNGYIACKCLFHDDSRPSMFIYSDTYRCSACGAFGNTDKLLADLSGSNIRSKPRTDKYDANPFTLWQKAYGNILSALKVSYRLMKKNPSIYLDERGITQKFQQKYRLGYMDGYYTVPCFKDDKTLWGAVARSEPGLGVSSKYTTPNGQSNTEMLYIPDWELFHKRKFIFLTFGILDAISLTIMGVPAASTLSGKTVNHNIFSSWNKIFWIWADRGEEQEAHTLASKMSWRGQALKINWPDGCKDVNDLLVKERKLLQETIELAYIPR